MIPSDQGKTVRWGREEFILIGLKPDTSKPIVLKNKHNGKITRRTHLGIRALIEEV